MVSVVTDYGSKELEIEAKRLQGEFVALKLAIEAAIIKRQRSADVFGEVPKHTPVSDEYPVCTRATARPGVVGWVDDL